MRVSKKAMLAAGLIVGAAALTGCTANTTPAATPTPKAAQQETAMPVTAQPTASATPEATMEPVPKMEILSLTVDGKALEANAIKEEDKVLLPIKEMGEALGYETASEKTEGESGDKHSITLDRGDSRITVSFTDSDNTLKNISWQKDGLLIPVDPYLKAEGDMVYAPAAFYEEAMGVNVMQEGNAVMVMLIEPSATPETTTQDVGKNG